MGECGIMSDLRDILIIAGIAAAAVSVITITMWSAF